MLKMMAWAGITVRLSLMAGDSRIHVADAGEIVELAREVPLGEMAQELPSLLQV
jgi:hypothetical protein